MNSTKFEPIFRAVILPCLVLKPQEEDFLIIDANEAYLNSTVKKGPAPVVDGT